MGSIESLIPAVSPKLTGYPPIYFINQKYFLQNLFRLFNDYIFWISSKTSITSRVVPGIGETMEAFLWAEKNKINKIKTNKNHIFK